MFTGIIEETGIVESIKSSTKAIHLAVRMQICGRSLKMAKRPCFPRSCLERRRKRR